MPPETYLFISNTQVDLLYTQIPEEMRDSIAARLQAADAVGSEAERKLALVSQYVEETEDLGTVAEPASYFRGKMKMQWGIVQNTALFVGQSEEKERLFVLLGGASQHTIDVDEPVHEDDRIPPPALAGLLALFQRADSDATLAEDHYTAPDNLDARLLRRLPWLTAQLGAVQTVEFLARTLSVETSDDRYPGAREYLVIGAPLFVAAAGPPES